MAKVQFEIKNSRWIQTLNFGKSLGKVLNAGSKNLYQPWSCECVFFSEVLSSYDDLDSDVIKNYSEFSLASLLYYGMKEGACSEQSSRMTAMDSASKNAGK